MTYFTAKEISDLDNSMVAAQQMKLGTVVDQLVNAFISASVVLKVAGGGFTPTAATTIVTTGLSTVTYVVAGFSGSLTYGQSVTASSGSVAGKIWVKCWQPSTSASNVTIAATGSYVDVNWIAVGT